MGVIFYCSHISPEPDQAPSGWISEFIQTLMEIPHIDKVMHMGAYFTLGVLGIFANKNRNLFAFIIGCIYAVSDEFHQSFIPGRHSDIYDVCADVVGLILANYIFGFYYKKVLDKKNA
jgi:VanZ family protein